MEQQPFNIEKLAPKLLLKKGVEVPVSAPFFLRIFGKRKVSFHLYTPTSRTLLKIAYAYLKTDMKNVEQLSLKASMQYYATNSKIIHRVIALGFLNSPYKNWLAKPLAWWLSRRLEEEVFLYLYHLLVVHGGVEDFIDTIRLIKKTRITKPMNLSQEQKTS